jgi:hypothetical protein
MCLTKILPTVTVKSSAARIGRFTESELVKIRRRRRGEQIAKNPRFCYTLRVPEVELFQSVEQQTEILSGPARTMLLVCR